MIVINQKKFFRFLSFTLILTNSFLPIVANNLPPVIGSYRFLWAPLWLISLIIIHTKILYYKKSLYFLFYGLIFIHLLLNSLWAELRDWDKQMVIEEYYMFAVSLSIIWYFRMEKDYSGLALLAKWTLIFITITAILSIYSSSIDPMYARNIIGNRLNPNNRDFFSRIGGGNYGFAGSLIALFPIMVFYYRNNSFCVFSKNQIILFGLVCMIALIRMQIFANIMIAILFFIIALIGSKKIRVTFLLISLLILTVFLIPKSYYSEALIRISHFFNPNSEIYFKLTDTANFILSGDLEKTGAGARAARYPLLLKAFADNPLFGYYANEHLYDIGAGGHLYWMNKLTIFGLLGFIPFLIIHFNFIKSSLKYFSKEYSFYFLLSVFSIIFLGFFKNLDGREMWVTYFVLLPGLYYLPLLKGIKFP